MDADGPGVLARNVRRLREARGLSQNALAKRAGISQTAVWGIEEGRRRDPNVSTVAALAAALGVAMEHLLLDDGPPKPG